jgi:GGDEF domain-containing protein
VQGNLAALAPDQLSVVLQYLPDALMIVGEDRRVLGLNAAAEALTGLRADEVVGQRTCQETIACHDRQGRRLCDACPHFEAAASRSTVSSADVTVHGASGLALPVVASYFPLPAEGPGPRKDAVILCELTARPEAGTGVASGSAVVDPETGFYTRERFDALYARERARAERYRSGLSVLRVAVRPRPGPADATPADLDTALRAVAGLLARGLRTVDIVGRCDTHDCAVLLPAATFAVTRTVVSRLETELRGLVERAEIPPTVQVQLGVALSEGYEDLLARSGQRAATVIAGD